MATPSGDLRDLQPEQVLAYDGEARGRHAHSTPALLVSPLLLDSVESDVNPLMRREVERGGEKRREAERSGEKRFERKGVSRISTTPAWGRTYSRTHRQSTHESYKLKLTQLPKDIGTPPV